MNSYLKAMRNYATFQGRSPRPEYWIFSLIAFLIGKAASLLDAVIEGHGPGVLCFIAGAIHFTPAMALGVRRMHDIDRTGWWIILPTAIVSVGAALTLPLILRLGPNPLSTLVGVMALMIPVLVVTLLAAVRLLTFLCAPGTPGSNRFGPEPADASGVE